MVSQFRLVQWNTFHDLSQLQSYMFLLLLRMHAPLLHELNACSIQLSHLFIARKAFPRISSGNISEHFILEGRSIVYSRLCSPNNSRVNIHCTQKYKLHTNRIYATARFYWIHPPSQKESISRNESRLARIHPQKLIFSWTESKS